MISEGCVAPQFELPALVDGECRRVALSEYLGDDVIILAFYPADFNPACGDTACDLDELDLFTMQKDVTILGISPDSVYSHRNFAETYCLNIPLLADTDHEVATQYDVDFVDSIGQRLIKRAVVVIDHDGVVQYAWSTDDYQVLPKVEAIKDAIADTGGDTTAFARYRVGHAHYTEGRRGFTAAMDNFRNSEWMLAQGDFKQAAEEFEDAAEHFDTAARFVDDQDLAPIYEDAKSKAGALWQAADWLTQSASAYSSGSGAKGQALREDAERPLETARGYEEPPDPDDEWPPTLEDLAKDESDQSTILPSSDESESATLAVDIDDKVEQTADAAPETESAESAASGPTTADGEPTDSGQEADRPSTVDAAVSGSSKDKPSGLETEAGETDRVDDAEIEEIQAELEASQGTEEPAPERSEEPTAMVDEPPETISDEAVSNESDDELELKDPTDSEDDDA